MHRIAPWICLLCSLLAWTTCPASSLLPLSTDEHIRLSAAIFRGTILNVRSYEASPGGTIYTRAVVQVEEVFKGTLPARVNLVHRGGEAGGRGMANGSAPQFKTGEQWLLLVSRRANGTLHAARGPASALRLPSNRITPADAGSPVSTASALLADLRARTAGSVIPGADVTGQEPAAEELAPPAQNAGIGLMSAPQSIATNLLTDTNGIPARFILPDRGEPIPYWIDADYLPAGMTQTQAVAALQSALAAWTNAASLQYRFAGIQSFMMAVSDMTNNDGRLLLQLHDHYGSIEDDALGLGGHSWTSGTSPSGWTKGGNVAGNDFHKVVGGTIVLQHTNGFMQNITNFTEVLCHEIGHTIGLGHSSQDENEPNPLLAEAAMYYLAHGNGRGAVLNAWDTNVVQQAHPQTNTPPWCYDRVMDVIHSPEAINTPGVNSVQVPDYDLQTTNLTLVAANASTMNGTFSIANHTCTYVPYGWYGSDSSRFDPAGNSFWDVIYARYADGVHASPYVVVRVVSLLSDTYSEGIPDSWRLAFFGSPNPADGPNRYGTNDFDADGFSNQVEWWLGSCPTNATSNLRISAFSLGGLQWPAKGHEVYELYASTDFNTWVRAVNPVVPANFVPGTNVYNLTNSTGTALDFPKSGSSRFFRLTKIP